MRILRTFCGAFTVNVGRGVCKMRIAWGVSSGRTLIVNREILTIGWRTTFTKSNLRTKKTLTLTLTLVNYLLTLLNNLTLVARSK